MSDGMLLKGDRSFCLCLFFHFSSWKRTLEASDKSCTSMVSPPPIKKGHHHLRSFQSSYGGNMGVCFHQTNGTLLVQGTSFRLQHGVIWSGMNDLQRQPKCGSGECHTVEGLRQRQRRKRKWIWTINDGQQQLLLNTLLSEMGIFSASRLLLN